MIEEEGVIQGFIITLGPGQQYDSPNYEFFTDNFQSFEYVDRIVIGEKGRGNGLGTAMYNYIIDQTSAEHMTCEVNLEPPNPGSLHFHSSFGFEEVGRQYSEEGKKFVSLMAKRLN